MIGKIVSQGLHPLLIARAQWDIRDMMETDEINPAIKPTEQTDNFSGMGHTVIEPIKDDILKR